MRSLTRRFLVKTLDGLKLSDPWLYERFYINDNTRIQNKNGQFEKEVLNNKGEIIEKSIINKDEFLSLAEQAEKKIARKSYLYLGDDRISIKEYLDDHAGFIRAEVEFKDIAEQENFRPYPWMISEITDSPLAFDSLLQKLSIQNFRKELAKKRGA